MQKNGKLLRGAIASMLCLSAISAFAVPAKRGIIEVTQPDGSSLSILLHGDERGHMTTTADGYPLLWDDARGYVFADIASDGRLIPTSIQASDASARSSEAVAFTASFNLADVERAYNTVRENSRMNVRSAAVSDNGPLRKGPGLFSGTHFPAKGEQKAIVILVEFQNVKFDTYNRTGNKYSDYREDAGAHEYFTDMLNKQGFDAFGGTGSCRDWFIDNSKDEEGNPQFIPQFDLFGPVTLSKNMSYYGGNDYRDNDQAPEEMVIEACKALDDEVDFSQYDRDGDGYVDNIYIFYAGYGEADGGPAASVWPHSWAISSAGKSLILDGVRIDTYGCSNETDFQAKRPDGIGTFTHEFSHVMGLPDLYATTYTSSYTPGAFSVMDYGPYNNNGCTPPNYSAFERYALGWMEPLEYDQQEGEFTLTPIAETNLAYIVRTEKDNEFFLCEARPQTGWDAYIPGHGMLIWHVDYNRSVFDSNKVNNTPAHQYVDLIEANERTNARYAAGHPFPGTDNVDSYTFTSWAKADTGVSLSNISELAESGNIQLTAKNVNATPGGISAPEANGLDTPVYYNLQGMRVSNPSRGELLIRHTAGHTEKIIF